MKTTKLITVLFPLAVLYSSQAFAIAPVVPSAPSELSPLSASLIQGVWRGEFTVNEDKVPFNFEIQGDKLIVHNGTRRDTFPVRQQEDGKIFVGMNTYDAALIARIETDGRLVGEYTSLVPKLKSGALPFVAEAGKNWRFVEPGRDVVPKADLSGKWNIHSMTKDLGSNDQVALLKQEGNKLTGVILTVVGDSRELEGTVQGDQFYLSGFSGPSPFFVKGRITDNGGLEGAISLGIYRTIKIEGVKRETDLPDPYKLTYLKDGRKTIDFSFPDLNGKLVSPHDDKYKGKVTIIEIIGTWCPNCTDQTRFLSPWFTANKDRGVEAIAVGFEQQDNFDYAKKTLGKLKDFFAIDYDIVFGGIADKKIATQKLDGLNFMAAFPTTIILDRKGEVREIYTGYTGTITGKYYEEYVSKFNKLLDELIAEPNPYEGKTASNALPEATLVAANIVNP
jgi:peroxiredoxin